MVLLTASLVPQTMRDIGNVINPGDREWYGTYVASVYLFAALCAAIALFGIFAAVRLARGASWARPVLISLFLPGSVIGAIYAAWGLVDGNASSAIAAALTVAGFGAALTATILSCRPSTNRYLRACQELRLRQRVPYMFAANS